MAVIGRKIGRADIRLVRGDTEQVGIRWRKRDTATGDTTPVDLREWTATLELRSPDGTETWYSTECSQMTIDGYAIATIPPGALTGTEWDARRTGQWKIVATSPAGVVRTLGWGYYTLSD